MARCVDGSSAGRLLPPREHRAVGFPLSLFSQGANSPYQERSGPRFRDNRRRTHPNGKTGSQERRIDHRAEPNGESNPYYLRQQDGSLSAGIRPDVWLKKRTHHVLRMSTKRVNEQSRNAQPGKNCEGAAQGRRPSTLRAPLKAQFRALAPLIFLANTVWRLRAACVLGSEGPKAATCSATPRPYVCPASL